MALDNQLRELYTAVERYVVPLLEREPSESGLTPEECRILALQNINRLNQRIGFLVRKAISDPGEMRILQTYVNSLTIGLKSDNKGQMRAALSNARNFLIERDENKQD